MKRIDLFFTFIVLPIDIVAIVASFVLAYYLRGHIEFSPFVTSFGLYDYLQYAFLLLPIWIILMATNGLYSPKRLLQFKLEFYKVLYSSTVASLLFIVIIYLTKTQFYSRLILVMTWALSILLIYLGRAILQLVRQILLSYGIGKHRVLIIGEGEMASRVANLVKVTGGLSYEIAGFLSDNDEDKNSPLLGHLADLKKVVTKDKIDEVVVVTKLSEKEMFKAVEICDDRRINFKYVPDLYSMMSSSFKPALVGSVPVMELTPTPLDGWGRITKRLFDLVFSLLLIVILSPVLLIIAILEKLTSKGPVLYLHRRIGKDEKEFNFYKFRSMYLDKCDFQGGVYWTTQADNKTRVTPLGQFLRKTNLDELPQIFNIFKGDMSFVGPRPELPKLVEKFEDQIPDYFRRHRVKVGLTGWAQVNGLKGDTSIAERVKYDIYYIENWSLLFDLKIICKTFGVVLNEIFKGKTEYRNRP